MVEMYKLVHGKYDKNTSHIVKLYKDHNPHSDITRGHVWKVCKEINQLNIRNGRCKFGIVCLKMS